MNRENYKNPRREPECNYNVGKSIINVLNNGYRPRNIRVSLIVTISG